MPPPSSAPRTGDARRAVWTMMRWACRVAASVHVLFVALFAGIGLPLLVAANILSIALFIGSDALLKRRRNLAAVTLIGTEIAVHAILASLLLGWDSGFHYYLLTIVGPFAITMSGTTASKVARLLGVGVGYILLDALTRRVAPVYRLDPMLLDALRYANVSGLFAIIGFTTLTYYRQVTAAENALRTLAGTDQLTGLYNRRHLSEIAEQTLAGSPNPLEVCVLICDIDHFKRINDAYGHETGDLVLQQVAHALKAAVRSTDSVARWGGEEFVVLMPLADAALALQIGERIRGDVAGLAIEPAVVPSARRPGQQGAEQGAAGTPHEPLHLTITIGVARFCPSEPMSAAIARADAALYRGKTMGRNRVVASGESGFAPLGAA